MKGDRRNLSKKLLEKVNKREKVLKTNRKQKLLHHFDTFGKRSNKFVPQQSNIIPLALCEALQWNRARGLVEPYCCHRKASTEPHWCAFDQQLPLLAVDQQIIVTDKAGGLSPVLFFTAAAIHWSLTSLSGQLNRFKSFFLDSFVLDNLVCQR